MGIPVQKWQWPVNQTRQLGATRSPCVKLREGKTVLTFRHERVWEGILSGRVISFAFRELTWDASNGVPSRGGIKWQDQEQSISIPLSFCLVVNFSLSYASRREKNSSRPLNGFLAEVEFGGAARAHCCGEAAIDPVSQVTALLAHWTTRLLIKNDGYVAKWPNARREWGACQTVIDTARRVFAQWKGFFYIV